VVTRAAHLRDHSASCGGRRQRLPGLLRRSLFLPDWFVRRRGLAMSLAFGVGVGSMILLPWLQT
jgi:hypothetical protein